MNIHTVMHILGGVILILAIAITIYFVISRAQRKKEADCIRYDHGEGWNPEGLESDPPDGIEDRFDRMAALTLATERLRRDRGNSGNDDDCRSGFDSAMHRDD